MSTRSKQGFSLIEVMIFISILSIVFLVSMAYVINLLRAMKISEHRIMAVYYAEELREWLKSEKEADWDAFSQKAGLTTAPYTYCFNNDIAITDTVAQMSNNLFAKFTRNNCNGYTGITGRTPTIYRRTVVLTKDKSTAPTSVEAKITVTWIENGTPYTVPLNAKFTVWE